jgi:hypothetical protein
MRKSLDWFKRTTPEQVTEEANPECVPNPAQAANLLAAVWDQSRRGRRLVAERTGHSGPCDHPVPHVREVTQGQNRDEAANAKISARLGQSA